MERLDAHIRLPHPNDVKTLSALKPFEDALDALVCCWVGGAFLAGTAYSLGDETAGPGP